MIVRLRARTGVYLSAVLLLAGMALMAQATEPVTRSQAEAMIDARLAAAGVLVCGAFWVLMLNINGRSEKALVASIARLERVVEAFSAALEKHDLNADAHVAAREKSHTPMQDQIDRIESDAERIQAGLEGFIRYCKTHQCAMGQRNPADSPNPRRADDPVDDDWTAPRPDGGPFRGKRKA